MQPKLLCLLLFSLALLASPVWSVTKELNVRGGPEPPNKDPFYDPPSGWQNKSPGTVLRSRQIQGTFLGQKVKFKHTYQLLYRTTGNDGKQPMTTVTTVFIPYNARKNQLLVATDPQDANAAKCSASFAFQPGSNNFLNIFFTLGNLILQAFTTDGFITTIPDHEGVNGLFANGRLQGHAALDALRATLNFKPVGLNKNTPVAGYGYSGGGIVMGWSSSLQPTYAPELKVAGWTFGGTPTNLTSTVKSLDGGLFAGFAVNGVVGLLDGHPKLKDKWSWVIKPVGQKLLNQARHQCAVASLISFAFKTIESEKYIHNGTSLLEWPEIRKVVRHQTMALKKEETPRAPVFMVHSHADEIIPYSSAIETAKTWCKNGANIHFRTYTNPFLGHIFNWFFATPEQVIFLRNVFDGKIKQQGCKFDTSDDPLVDKGVLGEELQEDFHYIKFLFGQRVGPDDKKFTSTLKSEISKYKQKKSHGSKHGSPSASH